MDSMENVVEVVSRSMLLLASLAVFWYFVKAVIPRFILRIDYSFDTALGRGLKKYRYPGGRAVVYEPHPSVRKYINKYALFTNDGYKYLKCLVDKGVSVMEYSVIMLNNRDKVIDVLDVRSKIGGSETKEVLLHPDTSYVAVNLESVNGMGVKGTVECRYKLSRVCAYFLAVAAASFAELYLMAYTVEDLLNTAFELGVTLTQSTASYIAWSVLAAGLSVAVLLIYSGRKGIKVVINGKR